MTLLVYYNSCKEVIELELYEKIKARRLELNLTLEDVGNIVGVGKSTVRKWETGNIADMKRDKIALLSKALQVSPLFIMGIEEKPQPTISESEKKLLSNYNKLNDDGKRKLIEYSNDLIGNQRYSLSYDIRNGQIPLFDEIEEEKDYLKPIAAHNDNQNDPEQQQLIKNDLAKLRAKKNANK